MADRSPSFSRLLERLRGAQAIGDLIAVQDEVARNIVTSIAPVPAKEVRPRFFIVDGQHRLSVLRELLEASAGSGPKKNDSVEHSKPSGVNRESD